MDLMRSRKSAAQFGFTLVEVVVSLGILSVFLAAGMAVTQYTNTYVANAKQVACLVSIKSHVISLINRDPSWNMIQNYGPNRAGPFSCFPNISSGSCPSGSASRFAIPAAVAGNTAYDTLLNPTAGFTNSCRPCGGAPSATCPIQLRLTYGVLSRPQPNNVSVLGSYAPTTIPVNTLGQITITGTFTGIDSFGAINWGRYGFTLVRSVR